MRRGGSDAGLTQQNVWDPREVGTVTRHFYVRAAHMWFLCIGITWGFVQNAYFDLAGLSSGELGVFILTSSQVMQVRPGQGPGFKKQGFLKGCKNQSLALPLLSSPPVFGTCCLWSIAGILTPQLQPSAGIPGDPGKHTSLQGHGRVTEAGLPKPARVFSSLPSPSLPCLPQTWDLSWSCLIQSR